MTLGGRSRTIAGCMLAMAASGFLLFHRLGAVEQPIWDENYYLTATGRYELGRAQFASHPPLGLMLIAAGDRLSGLNRRIDWRPIAAVKSIPGGDMPIRFDYRGPRLASALAGTIGAALFFLLMLELSGSRGRALALTSLWVFDTALIAQFRGALLDAFQLLFVLLALLAAARATRGGQVAAWTLGFGVAAGLATMVRANGIVLAAAAPVLLAAASRSARRWRTVAASAIAGVLGFAAAVLTVVAVNLAVAPHAPDATTPAGVTDASFVSAEAARYYAAGAMTPRTVLAAADDIRRYVAADLAGMARTDANASSPWGWPFGCRAIIYRWDAEGGVTSYIALVPNLAAWLVGLAGLAWSFAMLARSRSATSGDRRDAALQAMLAALWLASMALYLWLARNRVMYLYHYFIPLIAAHGLAAIAWRRHAAVLERVRVPALAFAAVLANFVAAAPLALHQPVGDTRARILIGRTR